MIWKTATPLLKIVSDCGKANFNVRAEEAVY